jgi:vesicular inhibitory amino acid transporter
MMALLGSFFSFTVSVVFPTCCYMILYGNSMTASEWILESLIALIGGSCATVGTIWVFLPEST